MGCGTGGRSQYRAAARRRQFAPRHAPPRAATSPITQLASRLPRFASRGPWRRSRSRDRHAAVVTHVRVAMALLLLVILAAAAGAASAQDVKGEDGPEVRAEEGVLRGVWVLGAAATEIKFAAFRGVPYAAPPVGPLRFKAPRAPESWGGVRNATVEGAWCPQGYPDHPDGVRGEEDCLYLNLYSPAYAMVQADESNGTRPELLPVLFFVHGGFFYKGAPSGMDLGPELLLQHGVVVVTPAYRLGALGFAGLDTDAVPGNAGLKDVLAALRWTKANVAAFGGDPNRLTVAGHGAGAAIAHYLTLVPAAQGLATAAILQSGSALSHWAFTQDHVRYATELAARIDPEAAANETLDVEETLLQASVVQLLQAYEELSSARPHRVNFLPFPPSPERRDANTTDEEVLLPRDPEYLVVRRLVPSVPVLMGITAQEALLHFCSLKWDLFPEKMEIYNTELQHLLPLNLWPSDDTAAMFGVPPVLPAADAPPPPTFPPALQDIAEQVRAEYFAGSNVTNSSQQVVELLSDVSYNADVHRLAIRRVHAAAQPTFLYRFDVVDDYNLGRARRRVDRPGAVHTDEIGYMWRVEGMGQNYSADSLAGLTLRRLTTMWTNFVKTASPVPETTELLPEAWPATDADTLPRQTFMDIGEKLVVRVEPLGGQHMNFWRIVYRKLRNGGGV